LIKQNSPHVTDWSIIARMKRIGLEPGKSFDNTKVSGDVLAHGAAAGLKLMHDKMPTIAGVTNGWQMNTDSIGVYGHYYLKRAIVALIGLGANQPDDAIYPVAISDSDGNSIMAESKYVLHVSKDELPPVDAFWSLTMYDAEGFQIANSINRFAIGDRDSLSFNGDGSLDLYIQNEHPGSEKGIELATSPERRPPWTDVAALCAKAAGHEWNLESTGDQTGELTVAHGRATRRPAVGVGGTII
jgi:hypothetical protein